ncbi:hypothetical protein CGCF413_v014194 [Colletotrichum fructicola]|nr:hypothetical protein CGCF413_v014194 [Colletotrichum fructicola]
MIAAEKPSTIKHNLAGFIPSASSSTAYEKCYTFAGSAASVDMDNITQTARKTERITITYPSIHHGASHARGSIRARR